MPNLISNKKYYQSVSATAVLGTTPVIDFTRFERGFIILPSGSPITDVDFYIDWESGGAFTHYPAGDISSMAADKAYEIPQALIGAQYVKLLVNSAGSLELLFKGFI